MRPAMRDWWRLDSWRGRRPGWLPRSGLRAHKPGARVGRGQLVYQSVDHLFRRALALLDRSAPPPLQVRVHVGRPVLHRVGVDRGLEVVGEHALGRRLALPRHHLRRNVLPEHILVAGHSLRITSTSFTPTTIQSAAKLNPIATGQSDIKRSTTFARLRTPARRRAFALR